MWNKCCYHFCSSFQQHPLHICTTFVMYSKAVSESSRLANQALYSYKTDMLCSYLQIKDIGCEEMCVLVTCHEQCFIRKRNSSEVLNLIRGSDVPESMSIFWTWIWKRTITQFMGLIHKNYLQSRDSLGEKIKTSIGHSL